MLEHQKSTLRIRETSIDDLRRLAASGHLFAIVDSCRIPFTPKKALEIGQQRAISLYRETTDQDFWDVAPYLFNVDGVILDWLLEIGATEGWGIFIASKADIGALRHHFRHFLKVQAPAGEIWYFRFFDPRVLRPFLPACSEPELRIFYGPVLGFGISDFSAQKVEFMNESGGAGRNQSNAQNYTFLFRLRTHHIEALRPQANAEFASRVMQYLLEERVGDVRELPQRVLFSRVCYGISKARQYGIIFESNLATFVRLMFEFAPNFDEHPHVQAILAGNEVQKEHVTNIIVDQLSESEWEEIEGHYRAAAWEGA